jgi:hypothetical protein
VVGGQTRSKGLPTDPKTQSVGGRDMVPPGDWGLVDNKLNGTHTQSTKDGVVLFIFEHLRHEFCTVFSNEAAFIQNLNHVIDACPNPN